MDKLPTLKTAKLAIISNGIRQLPKVRLKTRIPPHPLVSRPPIGAKAIHPPDRLQRTSSKTRSTRELVHRSATRDAGSTMISSRRHHPRSPPQTERKHVQPITLRKIKHSEEVSRILHLYCQHDNDRDQNPQYGTYMGNQRKLRRAVLQNLRERIRNSRARSSSRESSMTRPSEAKSRTGNRPGAVPLSFIGTELPPIPPPKLRSIVSRPLLTVQDQTVKLDIVVRPAGDRNRSPSRNASQEERKEPPLIRTRTNVYQPPRVEHNAEEVEEHSDASTVLGEEGGRVVAYEVERLSTDEDGV